MGVDHITTSKNRNSLEHYLDLYSDHQRRLYLYINAMLPNPADADEVFQETNIIIWRKFDQFEPGTDFLAWAYRIAFLQAKDYCRRAKRSTLCFSPDVMEQISGRITDDDDALESRRTALEDCKQKLDAEDRELIDRCYAPQAKVEQVAKEFNRQSTSVYRSLRRIRQLLLTCITRTLQGEA